MSARPYLMAAALGGVGAGTIDIGAACVINQRSIPFILHSIAGGLLAERSFEGGIATALLGLSLQEAMGILIAVFYAFAASRWLTLRRRWTSWGLLYGVVIFAVMNYVVVPLSAWRKVPHFTPYQLFANLAAMLLFGFVVAYFVPVVVRDSTNAKGSGGHERRASKLASSTLSP